MENEKSVANLQLAREELNKLLVYRESLINYYKNIKRTLDSLETIREDFVLLPIGSDAFVESKIVNKNSVIIGIGSGIFIEMSVENAKNFLNRRISEIEEEIKGVEVYIQSIQKYILELLKESKEKE